MNKYTGEMSINLAGYDYKLTITNKTISAFQQAADIGAMAFLTGAMAAWHDSESRDPMNRIAHLVKTVDERHAAEFIYQCAKSHIPGLERAEIEDGIILTMAGDQIKLDDLYAAKIAVIAWEVLRGEDATEARKKRDGSD